MMPTAVGAFSSAVAVHVAHRAVAQFWIVSNDSVAFNHVGIPCPIQKTFNETFNDFFNNQVRSRYFNSELKAIGSAKKERPIHIRRP
jgi:hypothetical protein